MWNNVFFRDFLSCGHFQMSLHHLLSSNSTLAKEQSYRPATWWRSNTRVFLDQVLPIGQIPLTTKIQPQMETKAVGIVNKAMGR